MFSRRDVLRGLVVVGGVASRSARRALAAAPQGSTPVSLAVPPGACDCHIHVIGDASRFPFAPERVYTPPPAQAADVLPLHRALHVTRIVVVQPSVYGTDNSCMLEALRQLGASVRGVAVIDERTTDASLAEMQRAGVHGVRVNLETTGQADPAVARQRLQAAIARVASRGWHVQVFTRPSVIAAIVDQVQGSPVPIVFDHFGGAQASLGAAQPGFDSLVQLVSSGHAYVKISGAYRVSTMAPDYPDVAPLAKALIAANVDRIVWGTDWPHVDSTPRTDRKPTDLAPALRIDDGRLMNQLAVWAPDAAQRRKILVDNPARLYGF